MAFVVRPSDGTPVVESSNVIVEVAAQDDVAVTSVELYVDGTVSPLVLYTPPYYFQVPVPSGATQLAVQAAAVDSFGHRIYTQNVILPVVADRPPTVAIAQPRHGETLTEGRDFALIIAAQDDVGIASVIATVEGGLGGTLNFATRPPPMHSRYRCPTDQLGGR
jgi:hypothetical protein